MSAENRRKQIVRVAAELFSKSGFSGTTTKEIADRAGVSEAIIFRHFASKEALYSAIIDHKVQQAITQMRQHLDEAAARRDDRAFFGLFAFGLLEFHLRDRSFMRLLLFSALEGHDLSRIFFNSTVRIMRRDLLRYIKLRIADGAYRRVDAAVAARAFVGMLLYHIQVRTIFEVDDLKISNRLLADRFVELFLDGLCRKKKPGRLPLSVIASKDRTN
jgi:AcrR family transcriptional regulator